MHIKIVFSCDNAAFEDDMRGEVKEVLLRSLWALDVLGFKEGEGHLSDTNGNTIGKVIVEEEQ